LNQLDGVAKAILLFLGIATLVSLALILYTLRLLLIGGAFVVVSTLLLCKALTKRFQ